MMPPLISYIMELLKEIDFELLKEIDKLNNKKSTGMHDIPTKILKACKHHIKSKLLKLPHKKNAKRQCLWQLHMSV